MLNLSAVRQDTRLDSSIIHFNNAGGSLPTREVTDSMLEYLWQEAQVGAYEIALDRQEELAAFYTELAGYLNTKPENIAHARSATEAFNRGLSCIDWQSDDIILTTKSDYVSNHLYFLQLERKLGVKTEILPEGTMGYDPAGLEKRLTNGPLPKLVSITHIPTNSGRVQDVSFAGQLCRKYNILYAVDACQSAGQLPLDVQAIGCDFLSATFRKYLRGPRGIGFLYISDRVLTSKREPLGMDLQGAEWTGPNTYRLAKTAARFETWESSKALQLGAAKAMAYINAIGIEEIHQRVVKLAGLLSKHCARISALQEHCYFANHPDKSHQSGILLFDVDTTHSAAELVAALRESGLHVSTSGIANDQYHFREQEVKWALRMSVHYYNTEEEIKAAVTILKKVLG